MNSLARTLPVALALGLGLVALSPSWAQQPDDRIDPRSAHLLQQGQAAQAAGRLPEAVDLMETALAVDPRNRNAFLGLASVARAQNLPGKAIRLYREALELEPNDVRALAGQGEAMVQKGAVERAKLNLARVKTLCKGSCPEYGGLAAAIAKGPPPAVVSAQAATTTPPKGEEAATVKPE